MEMNAEERHASIVALLEGNSPETDEELESVEEASDPQGETEELEATEENEEESEEIQAADEEEEYEAEEGHRVPYERFKQINDRKRQLQEELAARNEAFEKMQAQLNERHAKQKELEIPDDSYYFNEFEEEGYESGPDSWAAKFKHLESQNREMQVKFASMELEREITSVRSEFPDVPEEYLWETIAQNGNVSARDAAAHYTEFIAGIEEAAIAKYLKEQGGKADAPPRPSRKQTAASEASEQEWRPRNTDEAREALLAYLRS